MDRNLVIVQSFPFKQYIIVLSRRQFRGCRDPEKSLVVTFLAHLSYSVVRQTEEAWPPSWPIRTPRETNGCL